jgi:TonB family protein
MGYRALLFCPDEKTAQTVTLVLNDLEFTVEACSEPFAAVKKLMGEHFDGVVVDCDNEQNAVLLFKSARQSASNQASLAVAVVEGQAGVAKAFRIGANLVLTKPINVEQAKGTLRVARGLLRKSDAAKPVARPETHAETPAPAPSASMPSRSAKHMAAGTIPQPPVAAVPRKPPAVAIPGLRGNRIPDTATPVAHSPIVDEPIDEIGADETIDDASEFPPAPPFRTASPANPATPASRPSASKPSVVTGSASGASGTGAASAPAPARLPREVPQEARQETNFAEPLLSKLARTVGPMDDRTGAAAKDEAAVTAKAAGDFLPTADDGDPETEPYFPSKLLTKSQLGLDTEPETETEPETSSSKKIIIAVFAVILLALALYAGWTQILHRPIHLGSAIDNLTGSATSAKSQQPSQRNVPPAAAAPAVSSPPVSSSTGPGESQEIQNDDQAGSNTATDANENAPEIRKKDVAASKGLKKVSAGRSTAPPTADAQPLVVKSGEKAVAGEPAVTDTAAPGVVVSADSAASLPNLIDVSANSTPVLQTLAVSQGVSQGLVIKKVQPTYPSAALSLRLEGPVQLLATIGKKGNITAVKTISGEPLLAKAATDAIKQWKYKPYLLNGEPVEIQTQVTINFKLPR